MGYLSVVERELRAAAHHPKSWWWRVSIAGAAMVLLVFVLVSMAGGRQSASHLGRESFMVVSAALMIYALLCGPIATVDALSRERREGTLGLLFLTPLRSFDVVVGKMFAASLATLLGLAATLPVTAIPLLMGGVSITHFLGVALCLAVLSFFSLAAGLWASAHSTSGRAALAGTLLFLGGVTLGLPLLGEQVLGVRLGSSAATYFYMFCPLYSMELALDGLGRGAGAPWWNFWLNMSGLTVLACVLVMVAVIRTGTAWRDLPQSRWSGWLRGAVGRMGSFGVAAKAKWRVKALQLNPIYWLEGREVLQHRLAWTVVVVTTAYWFWEHLDHPHNWPDQDVVLLWPMFGHYILCLWVAIDAPKRLADDKHSGALELTLCTLVRPAGIVSGNMMALWRRFAGPLFALMALSAYAVLVYGYFHSSNLRWMKEMFWLALLGAIVMPVQLYSFARVGLYLGLVQATSLRATFMLVWVLGFLPWVLFIGFLFSMEFIPRSMGLPRPALGVEHITTAWGMIHLLVCGSFLRYANWQLGRNFRVLAAEGQGRPWWRRVAGMP